MPIVLATVCRRCRHTRPCRHVPDFCPCGARFGRDDHAVVEAEIVVRGHTVSTEIQVRFRGAWPAEERAALVAAVEQDTQGRTPDAGEET